MTGFPSPASRDAFPAGGDPDGVEYAGGLAQRAFLALGAAAEDARAAFPGSAAADGPSSQGSAPGGQGDAAALAAGTLPVVSALVVEWALAEAVHCGALLRRHALAPFAATGSGVGALLCGAAGRRGRHSTPRSRAEGVRAAPLHARRRL